MKTNKYISYFQSVLTIGIMSYAKDKKEAEKKAMLKLKDKDGVNYCVFDQTEFEPTETEMCDLEVDSKETPEGIKFDFNPNDKTRNIIATRLQKPVDDLTSDDIERFAKESIENALKA